MTTTPGLTPAAATPVPDRFRQVLGHFCTGITVITTMDGGEPAGFTCQSFAALSLDPPLVLFCPTRSSSTWPRIEQAGQFAANVLAEDQREVARVFGSSGHDRFGSVGWSLSPAGAPVLAGVLTWVSATIETVYDGGDHHVVVGRVTELGDCRPGRPLLFYRGRYSEADAVDGPPEVVDTLLAWPRHADWM